MLNRTTCLGIGIAVVVLIGLIVFCSRCKIHTETYKSSKTSKTSKPWDFVDKVVYINLAERKDRRQEIESELSSKIPKNKIIRFNAIRDSPGHLGCSQSHIKVIEMAIQNGWRNVLVVEDDAKFNKYGQGYQCLIDLIRQNPNFDVISMGNTGCSFDRKNKKLFSGQTTTGYLVNGHYFQTLLNNFRSGYEKLKPTKTMKDPQKRFQLEQKYCVDQYWKHLQKIHNWFVVNPALLVQRPSYSTITNSIVDYTAHFNQ